MADRELQGSPSVLPLFARAGLARGEPVFIAVPGPAGEDLRDRLAPGAGHLAPGAGQVIFADMARMGLNPARIIPAVRAFIDAHPGRRVRYIGEPAWPGRSADELRETARHEALINSAFRDAPATILCPYDTTALASPVIAEAASPAPGSIANRTADSKPVRALIEFTAFSQCVALDRN